MFNYYFGAERASAPWTSRQCRQDKKSSVEVPCQLPEAEEEEEYTMRNPKGTFLIRDLGTICTKSELLVYNTGEKTLNCS